MDLNVDVNQYMIGEREVTSSEIIKDTCIANCFIINP